MRTAVYTMYAFRTLRPDRQCARMWMRGWLPVSRKIAAGFSCPDSACSGGEVFDLRKDFFAGILLLKPSGLKCLPGTAPPLGFQRLLPGGSLPVWTFGNAFSEPSRRPSPPEHSFRCRIRNALPPKTTFSRGNVTHRPKKMQSGNYVLLPILSLNPTSSIGLDFS